MNGHFSQATKNCVLHPLNTDSSQKISEKMRGHGSQLNDTADFTSNKGQVAEKWKKHLYFETCFCFF
jgi:hypothetical protein